MYERNVDNFFRLEETKPSYLNTLSFVKVLESVYRIERFHGVAGTAKNETGVPAFKIDSMLSGHKVSSMPFNFYPPLSGQKNEQDAVRHLVSAARHAGSKYFMEYKTRVLLPRTFVDEHSLVKVDFSVTSELVLQSTMDEQRRLYKTRHRSKVNRALRNEDNFEILAVNDSKSLRHLWRDR